jgi:hypothetical protein
MMFPFHRNTHSPFLLEQHDNLRFWETTAGNSHYNRTLACLLACLLAICVRLRSVIIGVSFALSLHSGPVTSYGDEMVTAKCKL